jgi:site-specific DNA recombinase
MKTADLYIRVSTDEQAEKGYSQRSQAETLQKYCSSHSIEVRKIIFEDHSAKTFLRPAWQKLLSELRRIRGKTDYILFTKWDRFSRNAGDAYAMISTLRVLGVEPQAIEQPLDLTIPENKMMLAFYLAAPEVENDRRALNTFFGMRRATKEGRYMGKAPIGYTNSVTEDRRKYMRPDSKYAPIIQWAFQEIARGTFAADQVRKEINKKGIKCGKNNFLTLIRNPVYCGKVYIRKFKDEEAFFVQGQHEPLISETVFYEVQDIINGRSKKVNDATKIRCDDMLPLRGFLICPRCSKMLTGSASKGRSSYYYYYHCNAPCRYRIKAPEANDKLVRELKKYVPRPGMVEIYTPLLQKTYNDQTTHLKKNRGQILMQIEEINNRLKNARNLFADGKMDQSDYRELKDECQPKINALEGKLSGFSETERNIDNILRTAIQNMISLDKSYLAGSTKKKRQIIGSIFPEKLCFDKNNSRTGRINEAVRLIYTLDKGFSEIKKPDSSQKLPEPGEVTPLGLEPRTQRLRVFCSTN